MPSILGLMRRIVRQRPQPGEVGSQSRRHAAHDMPPRVGEILAVSTIPDFAGLPLELWPGYRSSIASGGPADAPWLSRR